MVVRMRQPYLRRDNAIDPAGTHIEDINIKDPIMDFYIKMEATNGATSNVSNSIIDVLDRIEIVDGSDVLWALDSEEILANQLYHYKESTDLGINETGAAVQATIFKIPLGIGRMHPEVAFDPTRFANPQLRIVWDTGVLSATTWADPPEVKLTIMADVIDQAPARPTGYLMTKQLTEYTTAIGEHRVELPVDYAYRTMYVRTHKATTCPDKQIDWVKHGLNEDKYKPFDIYTDDWTEWLKEWYGKWHQGYLYFVAKAVTETRNPYLRGNLSASVESSIATADVILTLPNCELSITHSHATLGQVIHAKCDGSLPFGTWAWPYGDPESPEEWLQLEYTDKSRLTINALLADATVQVFLTQHRMY